MPSSKNESKPFSFGNKLGIFVLMVVTLILLSSKVVTGPFKDFRLSTVLGLSTTFRFVFQSSNLSKIVQSNLQNKKGEYAVYIEDLTDTENYATGASDIFPAASLYKLYLLAAAEAKIEAGNLRMDDQLTASKSFLIEKLGSVDFGYEDMPEIITFTVEETLQRIGRISDNFAAIMLAEKIGWEKLQQEANQLGAQNTTIKDPISTTALDIAKFYKLLFQKQVVSEKVSDKIVELLLLNKLDDRIPEGIVRANGTSSDSGIKVVHKTGELPNVRHDAGIVYLPNGRVYVIVLMSKNLQYEDDGIETLANISKDVYLYFNSKP